jgi:hypothetical protein
VLAVQRIRAFNAAVLASESKKKLQVGGWVGGWLGGLGKPVLVCTHALGKHVNHM